MVGTSKTAPDDHGPSSSRDDRPDPATATFVAHRNLLFTVAYEMLGSAADAEDVLQETRLRSARSRTGRGHTLPHADRAGSRPRRRPETRWTPSNGPSKQAICKTCSTSSRRTSSSWVTVAESSRQCRGPS
jgi:hypothetical protein